MNVFYDHLVSIHELHIEFDRLDLPVQERNELMRLADSTIHHEIFDLIMVELPEDRRAIFLEVFSTDPSDPELLKMVQTHIPDAEEKIRSRAARVKEELAKEIRGTK